MIRRHLPWKGRTDEARAEDGSTGPPGAGQAIDGPVPAFGPGVRVDLDQGRDRRPGAVVPGHDLRGLRPFLVALLRGPEARMAQVPLRRVAPLPLPGREHPELLAVQGPRRGG